MQELSGSLGIMCKKQDVDPHKSLTAVFTRQSVVLCTVEII